MVVTTRVYVTAGRIVTAVAQKQVRRNVKVDAIAAVHIPVFARATRIVTVDAPVGLTLVLAVARAVVHIPVFAVADLSVVAVVRPLRPPVTAVARAAAQGQVFVIADRIAIADARAEV